MDEKTIRSLLNAAVRAATEQTRQEFQYTIDSLTARLTQIERPSQVEKYQKVTIDSSQVRRISGRGKSLPEFLGDHSRCVTWRQAAYNVYKIFENARNTIVRP